MPIHQSPVLYPWRVSQSTVAAIYILQYNCTAGGRCEWRPDRARSWLQCKRAFFVPLKECLMKFMRMSCPLSHTSRCKSRHRNPVCLHWNQNQEYEADSSCAEIQNLSIKYCRYLCVRILIFATLSRLRAMLQPWRGSSHGITAERCSGLEQTKHFPAAAGQQQQLGAAWNVKVSTKFHGTQIGEGAMLSTSNNRQLVRLAGSLKLHVEQPFLKSSSNIVKNFLWHLQWNEVSQSPWCSQQWASWSVGDEYVYTDDDVTKLGLVRFNHLLNVFSSLKVYHSF